MYKEEIFQTELNVVVRCYFRCRWCLLLLPYYHYYHHYWFQFWF